MKFRERTTLLAFRIAWRVIPVVPERWAAPVVRVLADLAWLRNGEGVRRLQWNLARVANVGPESEEARRLAREGMRRYARYWRELFAISGWDHAELARRIRVEDLQLLDRALAGGKGVIIVAPHSGNWETPAALLAPRMGGATTVAERLRPEGLFRAFVSVRERFGLEVLPHIGGDRPAFHVIRERLKQGRVIALVSDRDLGRRGVPVSFFGHTARMAGGAASLALATGAPILAAECFYETRGVVCRFHELPVATGESVEVVTQHMADLFARFVSAHPADWHMLQRVWVEESA